MNPSRRDLVNQGTSETQNTELLFEFLWTEFHYSDRRQCAGSLLCDVRHYVNRGASGLLCARLCEVRDERRGVVLL